MSNSLKEAFVNLESSIAHCQENSRSLGDVLKRGCADLADNAETKSSQDYSTTEHVIGKWIDGTTDVYEKTIVYTPESTISSATVIGSISNANIVIIKEACGVNSSQNRMWMLPMGGTTNISYNSGNVILNISNDTWSTDWTFYVTVRYTKTS